MKPTLKIFSLIIITSFLFSCNPATQVKIEFAPENITTAPGDTASFRIIFIPDAMNGGELGETFICDKDSVKLYEKIFTGKVADSVRYNYVVPADANIGEQIELIICAIDKNQTSKVCKNFIITVGLTIPEIITSTDVHSTFSATVIDSMSIELNKSGAIVDSGSSTSADIEFIWNETYGYCVVSPNSAWISDIFSTNGITYSTDDKNGTKFQLSDSAWTYFNRTTINEIKIENTNLQGGDGFGIQNLKEDDIIIFETHDGRKGAMKINFMTKGQKFLISDIKYQKTN